MNNCTSNKIRIGIALLLLQIFSNNNSYAFSKLLEIRLYESDWCKKKPKQVLKLIDAYSEEKLAGRPNQKNEIRYSFEIKVMTDSLQFDSVWINARLYKINITKKSNAISSKPTKFQKGDTIKLSAFGFVESSTNDSSIFPPPLKNKSEAFIYYFHLGERNYFPVSKINKRKPILRQ
ncbi:MAG: hypothetical protein ABI851_02635 [Saprospiraceae bacterium]